MRNISNFFETLFYTLRFIIEDQPKSHFLSEQELIQRCKQNEYSAQMHIYHLYKHQMFNASLRIVRNREDAEDIVQESFIRAFDKIGQIREGWKLGGWLKRIVVNASLDMIRKKKHQFEWNELHHAEQEVEEELESCNEISIQRIQETMNSLKEKYRVVLILYLIEDYTHKEISERLGINESTVRNQYRRGKQLLVKKLKANKDHEFRKTY